MVDPIVKIKSTIFLTCLSSSFFLTLIFLCYKFKSRYHCMSLGKKNFTFLSDFYFSIFFCIENWVFFLTKISKWKLFYWLLNFESFMHNTIFIVNDNMRIERRKKNITWKKISYHLLFTIGDSFKFFFSYCIVSFFRIHTPPNLYSKLILILKNFFIFFNVFR